MSEPRFPNGDAAAEAFKEHIKGKTVMITGGSLGGIGAEAAQIIARHDPKLLIVSFRTQEKADALFKRIRESSKAPLHSVLLDTSSMRDVREVCKTINGPIDVLIHNAGTAQDTLKRTDEGLELTVATNHVGPFLLTKELLPKMSTPPRVVMVSSGAHTMFPFRFDDWNWEKGDFEGMHAYGASKVGGVLFCSALARKSKSKVEAISLTPGAIYTNLVASNSQERKREMGILNEDGSVKTEWFISMNEGCRALITAAFDPELPKENNGAYLNSRAWIAPENQKPPNGIASHAMGEVLENRLWSLSEDIIGEKFEL